MSTATICDTCGRDVAEIKHVMDYRVALGVHFLPDSDRIPGRKFDLPLGSYDFCSRKCLSDWLAQHPADLDPRR